MGNERYFQTGQGRVFLQQYGANPGNPYTYLGCARMTGFSKSYGDVTPVRCPSADAYDQFDVVDEVRGEDGLPTTSVVGRFGLSNLIMDIECPFDVQAHWGECGDPTDFNGGWESIMAFERARFTTKSSNDLTAMDSGERATIELTGELTARKMYIISQMTLGETAEDEATREVVDVAICDSLDCGTCGVESRGCDKVYAVTVSSGLASPGMWAELLYSDDGGQTWEQHDIDTLASDESPSAMACVGNYIVVVSEDSGSLHYALKTDMDTWYEVNTGFVDNPRDIYAYSSNRVWIVGSQGYVYFSEDVTQGVEVQSDGAAASNAQLNEVHAVSSMDVVAVGNDNTIIYTNNGGTTWAAATGPAIGAVDANCVWVRSKYTWLVGYANGNLYYTRDGGGTWALQAFPGSGSGEVLAIAFAVHEGSPFGFLAYRYDHLASIEGRILRTLDGGNSWYVLPEGLGAIPDNRYIGALATCRLPNFVVGGGLADDGTDGIIVVGA